VAFDGLFSKPLAIVWSISSFDNQSVNLAVRSADTAVGVVQVWLELLGGEEGGKVNSLLDGHTRRDVTPRSEFSVFDPSFILHYFNLQHLRWHTSTSFTRICNNGLHLLIDIM